jgi:hypothetical protein
MKRKTQKQRWLLPFCLFVMGTAAQTSAQSADHLYVYSPNEPSQSFALDDICKITFTEQDIQVIPIIGSVASIFFDNIEKLTFTPQDDDGTFISSSVIPSSSGVKVYLDPANHNVVVESPVEITTVSIFNLQGLLIKTVAPQSVSASISLPACPSGVYIVRTNNAQGTSVKKIIKN